jgi:hypothetical protein
VQYGGRRRRQRNISKEIAEAIELVEKRGGGGGWGRRKEELPPPHMFSLIYEVKRIFSS